MKRIGLVLLVLLGAFQIGCREPEPQPVYYPMYCQPCPQACVPSCSPCAGRASPAPSNKRPRGNGPMPMMPQSLRHRVQETSARQRSLQARRTVVTA